MSSAILSKLQRVGLALLLGSNLGIALLFANPHSAMAGVITLPDGGRCEGELSEGKLSGPGSCQYANGDRYEGQFLNGKPHGQGIYTFKEEGRYQGEFADGEFNGQGVREFANGKRYEGSFTNGSPSGRGAFTFSNGTRCEGDIKEGKVNGKGVCQYANKNRYEGELLNNVPHGQGIYTFAEGGRYEGQFREGQFHGASSGSPGGSASNSSPGGGGNGGGGSSEPFGSGSGSVPKPTNPAREGSPSRPKGPPPATCISCGGSEDPSSASTPPREGRVELICDIDPNGKTFNIKILTPSQHDEFNRAAIKIVQERKYTPSKSGIQGERIVIIFRLTD
ncbi:TonB family protein [Microcoleus sp. MON1_C1]|uniref:TonB family protein n=1 Tax=Microcoleus sp. MON1_C1 TaxID=2818827 RepID=UPI002FD0F20F